jgi:hypothetical protein
MEFVVMENVYVIKDSRERGVVNTIVQTTVLIMGFVFQDNVFAWMVFLEKNVKYKNV